MRGEKDAPGVAGPMLHIQRGVTAGQERIAGVPEDRLYEIEIADQGRDAGAKNRTSIDFSGQTPGHFRTHGRPQQQRDKRPHRVFLVRGKGKLPAAIQEGIDRMAKQLRKHMLRNRFFVAWNGQTAFGDVKGAAGGPAIALGVVKHAIANPVTGKQVGFKFVTVAGERQLAGDAVSVEHQRVRRNRQRLGEASNPPKCDCRK